MRRKYDIPNYLLLAGAGGHEKTCLVANPPSDTLFIATFGKIQQILTVSTRRQMPSRKNCTSHYKNMLEYSSCRLNNFQKNLVEHHSDVFW